MRMTLAVLLRAGAIEVIYQVYVMSITQSGAITPFVNSAALAATFAPDVPLNLRS